MFPHPCGFVRDIYKTSGEGTSALAWRKKPRPGKKKVCKEKKSLSLYPHSTVYTAHIISCNKRHAGKIYGLINI